MRELLSEDQLREGVARLAGDIRKLYEGRPLTVVGVLTGSLVLLADLIRQLEMPLRVGLIQASSYRGAVTDPGDIAINAHSLPDINGREVLLVDDIYDTGQTLLEVVSQLDGLQPASIRSAVLLRKAGRSRVALQPDYAVFDIPDLFVVGYGLDYNDQFRNLPYVAALDEEDLRKAAHV